MEPRYSIVRCGEEKEREIERQRRQEGKKIEKKHKKMVLRIPLPVDKVSYEGSVIIVCPRKLNKSAKHEPPQHHLK